MNLTLLLRVGTALGALSLPVLGQSFETFDTWLAPPRPAGVFAVGDFDGDGNLDVVLQSGQPLATQWELLRNDGEGKMEVELLTGLPANPPCRTLCVGDFDGDGDLDLIDVPIAQNLTPAPITLLRNDGTGHFAAQTAPILMPYAFTVAPLDADGDGDLDLVAANTGSSWGTATSQLLLNDGTGAFALAPAAVFPAPVGNHTSAAVLDVQGDGLPDVVLDGWPLTVLLQNPGGGFTAATSPFQSGAALLQALDVDGDGDLDLVGVRTGAFAIHRNDGNGVFVEILTTMPTPATWRAADIDGDGDLDFVTSETAGPVRVWRTDPGLVLTEVTATAVPALASPFTVGNLFDADGDGDADLYLPQVTGLLTNDGAGHFSRAGVTLALTLERGAVAFDVDGDGYRDLIGLDVATSTTTANGTVCDLAWWRNDGTGHPTRAGTIAVVPLCDQSWVAAFDMDGDGDQDLWSLQCQLNRSWRNDGNGVFTETTATAFPLDTRADVDVIVRDFDHDGDLDAFVPRDYLYDSFYMNQGNGVFQDQGSTRLTDNDITLAAAALDFDSDGDDDLVLSDQATGLRLFANDGAGWFTEVTAAHLPTLGTPGRSGVAAVDVDGDGDPDLVLCSTAMQPGFLLRNDAGVFVLAPTQLQVQTQAFAPVALDADGDGDQDLLVGVRWYLNDGAGTFTLSPVVTEAGTESRPRHQPFVDIDGDADADLVFGTVRYNGTRQLVEATPARIGFHGEVRVHAQPTQPGFASFAAIYFARAIAAQPTPVPPFGEIALAQGSIALLGTVAVQPTTGYAAIRFAVPNQPALRGLHIPVQAVCVQGPTTAHTTNATVLTVW